MTTRRELFALSGAALVASALPALEAHFARAHHPAVHDLLAELGGVEIVFDDDAPFANLNRREDLGGR